MGLERHRKTAALKGCPERQRRSLSKHISTATAPGVYPNRIVKMLPSSRRRRAHHPECCRRALRGVRGAFRALGLLCRIPRHAGSAAQPRRNDTLRRATLTSAPARSSPGGCYIWSHGDPLVKHKIVKKRTLPFKRYQSDRKVTVKVR